MCYPCLSDLTEPYLSSIAADFPENAASKSRSLAIRFINQKEADFVVARIEQDRADAYAEPFQLKLYLKGALDLKIWGFATLFMLCTTVGYSISYFLPTILHDSMGFSVAMSECLIVPPYGLAAIWMFFVAWLGDRYHIRGPVVIFNAILGIVGLPMLGFLKTPGWRYTGVFLATTSFTANGPAILSWQANNVRGQWKRALASATLVGAGGLGGIIGSTVFRSQDKPSYRPGIYTTILAAVLTVVISVMLEWKFYRANKRAAAGGKIIEGLRGFRYTY
jgi:MFS family permease